jgi:hypothetical protein
MQLLNTLLLSSLACSASAFAPIIAPTSFSSALNVASGQQFDEDPALLIVRAADCSMEETCSVEEAQQYMQKLVSIENESLVKNRFLTEFVIGQLRDKIEKNSLASKTVGPELLALGVMALVIVKVMTTNFGGDSTVAMTMQEWQWSIQGGYFPLMVMHFVKDGGLIL